MQLAKRDRSIQRWNGANQERSWNWLFVCSPGGRQERVDSMRSLFLKIFLWFWLTVVLVGVSLVVTTLITHSQSQADAEGWKASVSFAVSGEANRAVSIYESGGPEALRKHFAQMRQVRFIHSYLLDENGKEVLDQRPPERAVQLASMAGKG